MRIEKGRTPCSRGSLTGCLPDFFLVFEAPPAKPKPLIVIAATLLATTRRARHPFAYSAAPEQARLTTRAFVNPAAFGQGKRDAVPRFRLPDLPGFAPELARVAARQRLLEEPQMNHLVLQDFN